MSSRNARAAPWPPDLYASVSVRASARSASRSGRRKERVAFGEKAGEREKVGHRPRILKAARPVSLDKLTGGHAEPAPCPLLDALDDLVPI